MSVFWAWTEDELAPGSLELSADESRHLAARRLREGDPLVVFDGRGGVAAARLEGGARRAIRVRVETVETAPPPMGDFVIASAVPKGDRLSTMLQMLSQLGAPVWQPLILEHSVVRKLDPASPRLRRILVESAKVARRPWLLEVRPPASLEGALDAAPAADAAEATDASPGACCFGDREGAAGPLPADCRQVLIGPEAGFSDAEREVLSRAGVGPVSFGTHNLRIETAAVAAAVSRAAGRSRVHGETR